MLKIKNPIQLNDWNIKTLFHIVLATQLSLWGSIGLDLIGIQIPLLRQIVSYISLTFIPGILILRILKLHKLGTTETFLYATGLSLSTLMFTGFIMNLIYPHLGISEPISLLPLVFTLTAVTFILYFLVYTKDGNFSNPDFIDLKNIFSPSLLILFLIPFLSIFGTYLVNYYDNNIILMSMIVVISFVILLNDYIPSKIYPLAIWVMAISLIYHITLISEYLNVNDVLGEYVTANSVIKYSYWKWAAFGNYNSVLSITMLAPIFYYVSGINLTYVFKIIYPLLFSFTSIGVYLLFSKMTNNIKSSFYSSIVFIIIIPFFYEVPLICKESIAEIFLVLFFLVIFNDQIKSKTKPFLILIFSISLVTSHYGISYLMMFSLMFVFIGMFIRQNEKFDQILDYFHIRENCEVGENNISLNFIILFFILTFGWYIYISNSSSFNTIISIGDYISYSIIKNFANPEYSRGLHMITKSEFSLTHYINKIFYLVSEFFVTIGFVITLWNYKKHKLNLTYLLFSLYFLMILFAAIIVPSFSVMDPRRLYHLSLFILAPFFSIGGSTVYKSIHIFSNKCYDNNCIKYSYHFLSVFLSIFLLFSTGFIYEVTNDYPSSISLSQKSISSYNDIDIKANFYGSYIVTQNVFSGKWLDQNMIYGGKVYRGDSIGHYPSLCVYNNIDPSNVIEFNNTTQTIGAGYVQISYLNLLGIGSTWSNTLQERITYNFNDVHFLEYTDKIYNNGGSDILWKDYRGFR